MTSGIGGSTAAAELDGLSRWPDPAAPITAEERWERIDKARHLLDRSGADAVLVGAGASLRYFAGIPWAPSERLVAMLLPRKGEPILICPRFELGSLVADLAIDGDVRLWEEDESPSHIAAAIFKQMGGKRLAVDPAMALLLAERIRKSASFAEIVEGSDIIDGCRMYKSQAELALMQQAKAMTLEVHRRTARILRAGISASEVRRFIDEAHKALGAAGSSFCIVQFGRSTAFPHGLPGECYLAEGDVVLIDTGCTVEGYHSDITRTYVFGKPSDDQRAMWDLEREAQLAAFDAVAPGLPCEAVDGAARRILEKGGLGPGYALPGLPHRTGHGIGLSIHEPAYLVRGDKTPLAPGMCFSNEPMIVVPERFGIRLEDHFYVTDGGAAWFTQPSPSIDEPFGRSGETI